jgi:hypothetical protein
MCHIYSGASYNSNDGIPRSSGPKEDSVYSSVNQNSYELLSSENISAPTKMVQPRLKEPPSNTKLSRNHMKQPALHPRRRGLLEQLEREIDGSTTSSQKHLTLPIQPPANPLGKKYRPLFVPQIEIERNKTYGRTSTRQERIGTKSKPTTVRSHRYSAQMKKLLLVIPRTLFYPKMRKLW